jgi:type III restriction enzyme
MNNIEYLYNTIKAKAFDYGILKPDIPSFVLDNLKHDFYVWQKEAFENFLTYQAIKERENPNDPTHLMFNMATGSGKTLLMAATILYYYEKGYSHFLFFVNQNNIVDKTENNFIDSAHTKYLFKEKIVIDDKTVLIKQIDNFSDNPQGIEIKFTTIQKLYNDIHLERENQTTLEDLHSKDIIMLADEAHHLNTDTKNKKGIQQEIVPTEITNRTSKKEIERKGWEHTVIELILNKNGNHGDNKNVLLEFTATIPTNEQVVKKYAPKTIYRFGLKDFLAAGYTKEINLISSTLSKKERVLQAILFHWYRHKIALKYGIPNFKPVILFRNKRIEESRADYNEFVNWVPNITAEDFNFLKEIQQKITQSTSAHEQGRSRTSKVLNFIKSENISYAEIAEFVKDKFQEKNIIITNSETNKTKTEKTTEEQEKLLNSLEDKNNHIRAIFTVDRLTEGWDVLNLFDIVRLYQGQNTGGSTKKTPEATIKEKQLIGRGVRYYPFTYKDKVKNKRKFDNEIDNDLRFLEELYYYTYDEESRYISHLKEELRKDGYISDNKIVKTFSLKKDFQESAFYKETKIWYNKQIDNPDRKKNSLKNLLKDLDIQRYRVKGIEFREEEVGAKEQDDIQRLNIEEKGLKTIPLKFKDIDKHIIRKAINIKAKQENSLLRYEKLKEELFIESMDDLLKDDFLGDVPINIIAPKNQSYNDLPNEDKLNITMIIIEKVFSIFKEYVNPKKGDEFTAIKFEKAFGKPKIKTIKEEDLDESIPKNHDWYVLDTFAGTSEEKELISFIKDTIGNLEVKYSEIYLLRNEEVYKIYDFDKGRGFYPDFLLFLKDKNQSNMQYQIFIEPKGNEFLGEDNTFKGGKEGWKEIFLEQISAKYGNNEILKAENKKYKLIGLPFFNKDHNNAFKAKYQEIVE